MSNLNEALKNSFRGIGDTSNNNNNASGATTVVSETSSPTTTTTVVGGNTVQTTTVAGGATAQSATASAGSLPISTGPLPISTGPLPISTNPAQTSVTASGATSTLINNINSGTNTNTISGSNTNYSGSTSGSTTNYISGPNTNYNSGSTSGSTTNYISGSSTNYTPGSNTGTTSYISGSTSGATTNYNTGSNTNYNSGSTSGTSTNYSNEYFNQSNTQPNNYGSLTDFSSSYSSNASSGKNCVFLPPLSLDQYKLNEDPNPEIIRKKPTEKIKYTQEVQYRLLEPPASQRPGDLIVRQLPNRQIAPAPPLVIRQAPPRPANPAPLVLREAPPVPPPKVGDKIVFIPGKVLPPPARKVVVERLPAIPPKPQQIFLEKWIGYRQQKRRVVFQPAEPDCVLQDPKNVVIQWENPEVEVSKQVKNLGSQQADPSEYVRQHGSSLLRHEEFVSAAQRAGLPDSVLKTGSHQEFGLAELEGDLQILRLVDLDRAGLAEYKSYLNSLGIQYDASKFSSSSNPYGLITSLDTTGMIPYDQALTTLNDLNAGPEKPSNESELRAYFNSLDTNGDGVVSFEEYASAFSK